MKIALLVATLFPLSSSLGKLEKSLAPDYESGLW
jgi:hypothetical protein